MINLLVISLLPLGWRPIHNDVDPEDLHGIQGIGEVHKRCQGDESEGSNTPKGRDHFDSIYNLVKYLIKHIHIYYLSNHIKQETFHIKASMKLSYKHAC